MDERRISGLAGKMKRHLANSAIRALCAFALVVVLGVSADAATTTVLPLTVGHPDVPLGGRTDRFDYESVDPQRRLRVIAHLGSGLVTVFNICWVVATLSLTRILSWLIRKVIGHTSLWRMLMAWMSCALWPLRGGNS
ncbi:MAG: hypothetical protein B7Z66_08065 [Chromatiales bacterium 21-64-14]|nr:MAG: hypothetical protein B7Z66_08065 [Chromatiales bacterium 21-64-14]